MAFKARKMAKLNPTAKELAAAATILSLNTCKRLGRNFKYYRNRRSEPEAINKADLLTACKIIRRDAYYLENLFVETSSGNRDLFKVLISKKILDQFEELHRAILFFDADAICDAIPAIDRQRKFWSRLEEADFYDPLLLDQLSSPLSEDIDQIENIINQLNKLSSNSY